MEVVLHKGVYKKTVSLSQAVFMITGMTIGAGIFGLPYVISRVGILTGVAMIIFFGCIMLGVNLMVGEIALKAGEDLQLPGLAGKYLGTWAKWLLSITIIVSWFGTLTAYLVGEGQSLSALLGGSSLLWGLIFWSIASFCLWGGLNRLKSVDRIVSALVIALLVGLALWLLPSANTTYLFVADQAHFFLPIGVIIFALHGTPAIAEVHALSPSPKVFRQALIIGTLIPVAVYCLFTVAVVLATGLATTEIATVGIGELFGPRAVIVANLIAIAAMFTCYLGLGNALRETFTWDHQIHDKLTTLLVIVVPLALYLVGFRSFILLLEIVGGVFITIELLLMFAVFLVIRHRSRQPQPLKKTRPPLVRQRALARK
jgi:amino acid permease